MNRIKWIIAKKGSNFDTIGKIGKYNTFGIFCNPLIPKDENKHILKCRLPGVKENLGAFETEEKAQEFAERAINAWMEGAGMTWKEE